MFYGNDVQNTRQLFYKSWEKHKNGHALERLEQQIVAVIADHPEYQSFIEDIETSVHQSFFPELGETNPFLHMGLHLAIRDQVELDSPQGITEIYKTLSTKLQSHLEAEHVLMEQLAEFLWQAQRDKNAPDGQLYLRSCQQVLDQA